MKNNKTILFYFGHPAHYHNVSHVMPALAQKGHKVIVFARGKDVLFDLIENLPYDKYLIEDHKKENSTPSLIWTVLKREWQLFNIVRKHNIDLLVGTDIVITHIGRLMNIPSLVLNEDDTDAVPLLARFGFKYSTHTLSPVSCNISPYNQKKIAYNSFHELAYLHPNRFSPKKGIVRKYLDPDIPYYVLRFAKLTAHHDDDIQGISNKIAAGIIELLEPNGRVIITSERNLAGKLEPYRLEIDPPDMHHIMAFADLYIGDSQTMAAEAGVLGIPFIRFNDFVGRLGYLDELENKYKLGYGIKSDKPDKLMAKISEMVQNSDLKHKNLVKRKKLLDEKIDFAAFLTWFIDEYPESVKLHKGDSDYQYRFR